MYDGANSSASCDYRILQNNQGLNIKCRCIHYCSSRIAIKVLKFWGFFLSGYVFKIWQLLIHFAMMVFICSSVVRIWYSKDLNYGIFSDLLAGISYYVDWWLCRRLVTNNGLNEKVIESELGFSAMYFSGTLILYTLVQDFWYVVLSEDLDYDNDDEDTDVLHKQVTLCFNISNVVVGSWARPCAILIAIASISQLQKKITCQIEKLCAGKEEPYNPRRDIKLIGKLARGTSNLVSVIIGQIVLESIFRFFWILEEWSKHKSPDRVFLICNFCILAQTSIPLLYGLTRLQTEKETGVYHLLTGNASYQVVELAKRLPTAHIFGFEVTAKKLAKMIYMFFTCTYAILQFSEHKLSF